VRTALIALGILFACRIGPTSREVNACDEIWAYFNRHSRAAP